MLAATASLYRDQRLLDILLNCIADYTIQEATNDEEGLSNRGGGSSYLGASAPLVSGVCHDLLQTSLGPVRVV